MNSQNRRAKTDAHHKEVAEAIIKMIEGGTAPWQKPWDGNTSAIMLMPFNGASKRRYRGINSLYLYSVAVYKGYKDPRWFTFKQVEELGGKVKRGEKSAKVEYWQFKRTIKEDENGNLLPKEEWLEEDRKVPLIMRSAVFNAEQCEGIPELELPKRNWEPLERAETIIKANGVPIFHDAVDRNYYSHGSDEIHLTPMEAFPTREAYYGTALHELGHSTGHEKRLNRQFGKTFGDENYAKEELRAEIASFMLCSDLGISRQASDEQHAAYVGSWVKALKSDPNEIFKASADAENICNYLYDREREYMKNLGNEIEPNVPNNSVNYPEIEPSVTKVAEQVAGYGIPDVSQTVSEEVFRNDTREIDTFFSTNYVSKADGNRMNVYVIDGKTYLGKSQKLMIEDGVDAVGRSVTHRYYDNSDGSLIYLSDKAKMASFLSDRSYGLPQDRMSNIGSYDFDDLLEAQHQEMSNLFINYSFARDRLPDLDNNLIKINAAAISNFKFGDKELNAFVKDGAVYVGLRERYSGRGVYDNSDYSLLKVSDNGKMFHLIQGTGYVDSQEAMLAKELFSERDFIEYAELKDGVLKKFEQVRELTFDGVPFKSPLAENEPVREIVDNPYQGMTEVVEFVQTNFEKDGKQICIVNMNGELYLGYDDNCKLNILMGDAPQSNKIISYYDNRDDSLEYLTDRVHMAHFIRGMSYGWNQDQMLMVSGNKDIGVAFSHIDYEEYEYHESRTFKDFGFVQEIEPSLGGSDIKVNYIGRIDLNTADGIQLSMCEKNGTYYIGHYDNFDVDGTYDNSDYSLFRVTNNPMVMELIADDNLDMKELIASGRLAEKDLFEYTVFHERTKDLFTNDMLAIGAVDLRASVMSVKFEDTHVRVNAQPVLANMKDRVLITGKDGTYLGKRQNMLYIYGAQNNYGEKFYDNTDGSLVKLSDNPKMAELISDRAFGYGMKTIMDIHKGEFTIKDFEEYNKIHDEHLSKLEFVSQYDDMGKFDFKEAMKMADEQVNGQVNEEVKEFNPPSDAQLALAESLHCKYKEDVSREELSKIIAKTMDARKKYYEAINQPAKDTQVEVLKEAGVEIKEGLIIGQASKLIAELPASIDQKVFMDRLKIEYDPDVTRGEVEKIIKGKMKELEAREKEPASEKTIEFMKSRGIDVPENVTRGEANKLIYNSAPTAKQMAFITIHKIECDKEKLTYGKASILVDKRLKYIDEQSKLPATEKQVKRLEKEKAEFAPDITRGEASKLINKLEMEKLQVSEKQIKFANDLGLEIPENATKAEVTKMIGEKIKANRIDKIAEFEIPKDRKLTIGEGYMKLAKKCLEKGKPIDDKQIAASLLKDGHRDCDVKQIVFKNSPNCVNDLSKAQSYVNEAKKLPSVKKAMEKENSR